MTKKEKKSNPPPWRKKDSASTHFYSCESQKGCLISMLSTVIGISHKKISKTHFWSHQNCAANRSCLCTTNPIPNPSSQHLEGVRCWDFRDLLEMMRTYWG